MDEKLKPKEIPSDPFFSDENMERIRKSIAEIEAGKGKIHKIPEVENL